MSQYRKRPIIIEAQQWLGPETPHPAVRDALNRVAARAVLGHDE